MVGKSALLALTAILSAHHAFALPAADSKSSPVDKVEDNDLPIETPLPSIPEPLPVILDEPPKEELDKSIEEVTTELNIPSNSISFEIISAKPSVDPAKDTNIPAVTEVKTITPSFDTVERFTSSLKPQELAGKPVANDKKTECLNVCANAVFLSSLEEGNICDSKATDGFYHAAQRCAKCICGIWSYVPDRSILTSKMEKCGINVPKCNPKDSNMITKRAIDIEENNLQKRCFMWITTTIYQQKPSYPRGCVAGYNRKIVKYPAKNLPSKRCYGHIVTYYPPLRIPATVITRPPCSKRRTVTYVPKSPPANIPKCQPGYNKGVIKVPGKNFPAKTVTNGAVVSVHVHRSYAPRQVTVGPCQTRRTVYVTRTRPPIQQTCNPGYKSGYIKQPVTNLPRKVQTGNNQVVTVYVAVNFPPRTKAVPGCQTRKTVWVTPKRPPFKPTCAPGFDSKNTWVPAKSFFRRVVTGANEVVTIHAAITYPGHNKVLPGCKTRKTVSTTPASPTPTVNCNPGYQTKVSVIPAYTFQRKVHTGKNDVVTVQIPYTWYKRTTTLAACTKHNTVTVTPPSPPFNVKCAPGYQTKQTVVPAHTYAGKVITGNNNIVTVSLAYTWFARTTTLDPCDQRKTVTVTPPSPPFNVKCAPGFKTKETIVPAHTFARNTITGNDNVVTLSLGYTWYQWTKTLPPCSQRSTTTTYRTTPCRPNGCNPGHEKTSSTIPAVTYPASTETGNNGVVTVWKSTTYPSFVSLIPPCEERKTTTGPPASKTHEVPPCVEGTESGTYTIPGENVPQTTETGTDNIVTIRPSTSYKSSTTMLPGCTPKPSITESEDTPEPTGPGGSDTESVDEPSSTNPPDSEPTESEDTPEPTESEDTPEPTESEDTPEPTKSENTPEPTESEDTPEPTESEPSESTTDTDLLPHETESNSVPTVTSPYPPPTPTETCASGTSSGDVTVPGTSYPGTTTTGDDGTVTVYPPTEYPDTTTMLPGCPSEGNGSQPGPEPTDSVPTVTSPYPPPTPTETCAHGTSSGDVTVPGTSYPGTTTTGDDGTVTVYPPTEYPQTTTMLPGCVPGEGMNSEVVSETEPNQPEPTENGPTDSMPTVTSPYPPPTPTETCAHGTSSGDVTVPGTSYPGTTTTGDDGTVTVYPPTEYPDTTTMLPGCPSEGNGSQPGPEPTDSVPTVTSPYPPPTPTETCAHGTSSGDVTVPGSSYPGTTTTGDDGTVTVYPPTEYPQTTTMLPGCVPGEGMNSEVLSETEPNQPEPTENGPTDSMPTVTSPYPSPTPTETCAHGTSSGEVTVPGSSYPGTTTTGDDGTVTVYPPTEYPQTTTMLPGCVPGEGMNSEVLSETEPNQPEPTENGPTSTTTIPYHHLPSSTCVEGTNSSPVTLPATSFPEEITTGSDNVVTIHPSTEFPETTTMLPGCTPGEGSQQPTSPADNGTPPTGTSTKCGSGMCTCVPKPPVCVTYDVYKAFYCGEWVLYKICNTFGFIGCGYDHYEKRDVKEEQIVKAAASVIPTISAATTTITDIEENLATALVDEDKSKKIVNAVIDSLKESEPTADAIKVMDPSEIDFAKIEQPKLVDKVTILQGTALNTAILTSTPTPTA